MRTTPYIAYIHTDQAEALRCINIEMNLVDSQKIIVELGETSKHQISLSNLRCRQAFNLFNFIPDVFINVGLDWRRLSRFAFYLIFQHLKYSIVNHKADGQKKDSRKCHQYHVQSDTVITEVKDVF